MMNQFDFYVVVLTAKRIGDLTKAGVERAKIETFTDGFKVYGSGLFAKKYPIKRHRASVGYVDVGGIPKAKIDEQLDAITSKYTGCEGVNINIKYVACD